MFKLNDQEISDLEMAQTYFERIKKRMEWCRNEAEEYLKNIERRKFYKVSYFVDSGDQTVYSAITDEDMKTIKDGIKQTLDWVLEEYGPDASEDEKANALSDYFSECDSDICWEDYLPEKDFHWAGGPPVITDVDFNDYKHFCKFKVRHTLWYKDDKEELVDKMHNVYITDDVYINLLTAKLFDKELSFYDLQNLYEDVYKELEAHFYSYYPHQHYIIYMTEINEAAKAIIDSKKEEELPRPINIDNPLIGIILNAVFKNADKFDDKFLLKSLDLAITRPDI